MKNYPILKFMLPAVAANTSVSYASSPLTPLKIYCCYFVSTLNTHYVLLTCDLSAIFKFLVKN